MRILIVVASVLLVAGCSAPVGSQASADSPEPTSPSSQASAASGGESAASAPTTNGVSVEPCELLTDDDLAALGAAEGIEAEEGLTAGVPSCQWPFPDGRYVQVIAASASDWALSLPDATRMVDESGLELDKEQTDRLAEGARLVEDGGRVDPEEACELFSLLLELQGAPPGQPYTVNVFPSQDDAQAVTGQMCTDGRFTSVTIASVDGLAEPLPVQSVADAVQAAHRRTLV